MSYDISLIVNKPVDVLDLNYTYNVSPMFRKAFGEDGIHCLHNQTGKEAEKLLIPAILKMKNSPHEYEALNPKNGWGDFNGAYQLLEDILLACQRNPEGLIQIT